MCHADCRYTQAIFTYNIILFIPYQKSVSHDVFSSLVSIAKIHILLQMASKYEKCSQLIYTSKQYVGFFFCWQRIFHINMRRQTEHCKLNYLLRLRWHFLVKVERISSVYIVPYHMTSSSVGQLHNHWTEL